MNPDPPEFESDDPMELTAMVLPGAPGQLEAMAECLADEYARMGWSAPRLMNLFVNPHFLATHRIYRHKGETWVRRLIDEACARWQVAAGDVPEEQARCGAPGSEAFREGARHG